ncbi:MAG: AAA family ATPase [Chlamydiota bacterium]
MFDELRKLSQHFLSIKNSPYKRYLLRSTDFTNRMSLIVGQRGVGKTTLLVQILLDKVSHDFFDERILYIQADHFKLASTPLYEIAEKFSTLGGKWLALDEIHKYPNWSKELKSIYDTFPELQIFASGSSALEIYKGSHDLSRRGVQYHLQGMSFREYLELTYQFTFPSLTLEEICHQHERLAKKIMDELTPKELKVIPLFHQYLKTGYYPFFYELKNEALYKITLEQNMHTTIESDIAAIFPQLSGSSIKKIEKLLVFIAEAVPFTPNWRKIIEVLEIGDERTLKAYFKHLEDAGLIRSIAKASKKFSTLESSEKVYLDNSNQMYAISSNVVEKGTVRETFFLSMAAQNHQVTLPQKGDFFIDNQYLFEIGGKNKTFDQIKDFDNGYLVLDEMEQGIGQKIPLWLFGFLY